jgi:F-type H+-transporting ATPase subunit delta
MRISKQAKRQAKQLFRLCLVNGSLDENRVREAVGGLVEKKPRDYVAMLNHLQRLVKLEVLRRTATVESATALTPELQRAFESNLTQLYGEGLYLSFKHNPELIGGARIRVGSDVYDGSVQGRLEQLQENF